MECFETHSCFLWSLASNLLVKYVNMRESAHMMWVCVCRARNVPMAMQVMMMNRTRAALFQYYIEVWWINYSNEHSLVAHYTWFSDREHYYYRGPVRRASHSAPARPTQLYTASRNIIASKFNEPGVRRLLSRCGIEKINANLRIHNITLISLTVIKNYNLVLVGAYRIHFHVMVLGRVRCERKKYIVCRAHYTCHYYFISTS